MPGGRCVAAYATGRSAVLGRIEIHLTDGIIIIILTGLFFVFGPESGDHVFGSLSKLRINGYPIQVVLPAGRIAGHSVHLRGERRLSTGAWVR